MNIHIVHLPHTFTYLVDLSIAFKKCGFDTVTLVANGFDQTQIQQLNDYAEQYDFVEVLDVPTKRILSHGQALNHAYQQSQDALFCFADHDIFPTSHITTEILAKLQDFDVVCMGNRPENTAAEYRGFAASAENTQSGTPLATSFFSVYKRTAIRAAKQYCDVGFEQYFRTSQIPKQLVEHADIQALREPFLVDTCKALSLAMHEVGKTVAHMGSAQVCHLGGMCGAINRYLNSDQLPRLEFVVPDMPTVVELEAYYQQNQQRHPRVLELKRSISDYALHLLMALKQGSERPRFLAADDHLNLTVAQIDRALSDVFASGSG